MDDTWKEAFAEEYDVIVLGTGMKECLLSGLLSVDGKKVFHLDRNGYYGGASASLHLTDFYEKFRGKDAPIPEVLGNKRDYYVDLVPKFIIASGRLVDVLVHTDVAKNLEFKPVGGSYVYRKGAIAQVPTTPGEALQSSLMGMMEKTRAVQFFGWVNQYKAENPKTHSAGTFVPKKLDLTRMTCKEFFQYWELEADTIEFVAHACALYQDNSFMSAPAIELVQRVQLYKDSFVAFPGMKSPFLYPCYGLGELPQVFARLAAVHGGTYMLNRGIDEVVYDEAGVAVGVKAEGLVAKAKLVIGDPSYFPTKVKTTAKVVRVIAILQHTLPGTQDADSCQIIFPQNQIQRKNDVYLFCCGHNHNTAAEGRYIACASTVVEGITEGLSDEEVAKRELGIAMRWLDPWLDVFYDVYDYQEPISDGTTDKAFISKGYDPTSHFETGIADVLDMYTRVTGKPLQLKSTR